MRGTPLTPNTCGILGPHTTFAVPTPLLGAMVRQVPAPNIRAVGGYRGVRHTGTYDFVVLLRGWLRVPPSALEVYT